MPQGFGYFWGGLAEGLTTGVNLRLKLEEFKEQKKLREEANDLRQKIAMQLKNFAEQIDELRRDGTISEDDFTTLTRAYLIAEPEVQSIMRQTIQDLQSRNRQKIENDLQYLKSLSETIEKLDPTDAKGVFEMVKQNIVTPEGKAAISVLEEYARQQQERERYKQGIEAVRTLSPEQRQGISGIPEFAKVTSLDENQKAVSMLVNLHKLPDKAFNKVRESLSKKGYDVGWITREMAEAIASEKENYYRSAEEAIRSTPDVAGFIKRPVQITADKWKVEYLVARPEPSVNESAYSAEQSRIRRDADELFDSLLKSVGVIDRSLATEEELQAAYQRWENIRNEVNEALRNNVDLLFKMYGVGQSQAEAAPEQAKPAPQATPTPMPSRGEIPTPEGVRPYANLSEEALKLKVMARDKEAIKEAIRRGYIKP